MRINGNIDRSEKTRFGFTHGEVQDCLILTGLIRPIGCRGDRLKLMSHVHKLQRNKGHIEKIE